MQAAYGDTRAVRHDAEWAQARFAGARVARLATVGADGSPHLVPITFALVGTTLLSAVDAKPKATTSLRRLDNIAANPFVSVLVDEYDDDWSRLWWARADGWARVLPATDVAGLAALVKRYAAYRDNAPDGPVVVIAVNHWSGWSAT
jgi:PPOX class probable F420-dependent enzyme